jgi:phenylpropionate dioxygenase-like ring-hydroxylating dioxygenase large terminal subunit
LLDEPLFLFRDAGGRAHALFDRCPHRFAPLSKGSVRDDVVTCGYHGLGFNGAGACVSNPHGPITRALSVRSYPIVEAHRALWIWMGDPALANATPVRDLGFLDTTPISAFNEGYVLGNGDFQLFVDNILDLSHTDYLHPTTLGGGSITRTRAEVSERDDGIIQIQWHVFNDVPTPLFAKFLPDGTARVDSWTEVEWSAPAVMKLTSGAMPTGRPRDESKNVFNVHIMTPERHGRTHYWFASTRDFAIDDTALNQTIQDTRAHIFSTEDEPMIAAQHERIGDADFWSLKPALLRIDEGAVKVRRRMDALIAAEKAVHS